MERKSYPRACYAPQTGGFKKERGKVVLPKKTGKSLPMQWNPRKVI